MASTNSTGKEIPPSGDMSLPEAYDKVERAEKKAVEEGFTGVLAPLPGSGKTYQIPQIVAETGIPAVVLTVRGRKEQYEEILKNADKVGIDAEQIPSSYDDCPSANETHGAYWKTKIRNLRNRGVRPSTIHEYLEPPCMPDCEYLEKMTDIRESDYDLLVGHYRHAHFEPAIAGRTVFFDEFFEDNFEREVTPNQISNYLRAYDGLPFDTYEDLVSNRDQTDLIDATRDFFEKNGLYPSESELLEDDDLYRLPGVAVWGILEATDLGNGWTSASFTDFFLGVDLADSLWHYVAHNRDSTKTFVLSPPDLSMARNVIGLDGTPTMEMWELLMSDILDVRLVFSEAEQKSYITNALNHRYILTTGAKKPYAPLKKKVDEYIDIEHDTRLLEQIYDWEGRRPPVVTTKRAGGPSDDDDYVPPYEKHGLHDLMGDYYHFPVLGSNKLKHERVGVVIGYQDYGDDFIQKWGAYAGESVPAGDDARENGQRDHGEFGNAIVRHMKEDSTLQRMMRFGRDGKGSTVYVDTNTIPDWVPIAERVYWLDDDRNASLRDIVNAAKQYDTFTTDDLPVSRRVAQKWIKLLWAGGYVDPQPDGRKVVYRNVNLGVIDRAIRV